LGLTPEPKIWSPHEKKSDRFLYVHPIQSSDFIIANPELKAKIIAASRRNSSAQANELKSTIICAGGCGKDGLQNQIYYRDERGWHSLTSLPVRRKNFAISVIDR
jgi:hypothetical protein